MGGVRHWLFFELGKGQLTPRHVAGSIGCMQLSGAGTSVDAKEMQCIKCIGKVIKM